MTSEAMPEVLDYEDIADLFRLPTRRAAYRFILANQAELSAFKVMREWRVTRASAEAYIRAQQAAVTPIPAAPADGRARRSPARRARAA